MASLPDEVLQWLFTPSALYQTPSQSDGYTLHQERVERARGIEFLFRVGLQLGMHQHTMSAACVYFHRFYMRFSFVDYHRFEIAATCLFLAGKTEENGRKLHDVASAVIIKLHRSPTSSLSTQQSTSDLLKAHEKEVQRFEQLITVYELVLAEALAFDLEVGHVQGVLVITLDELRAGEEEQDLGWTVASDTLYTPLCVLQPANVIAAACHLLALALLKQPEMPWADYLTLVEPTPATATSPFPAGQNQARKWQHAFGVSSLSALAGVRDSIAVMLEFWRSMEEETRRQFNTRLEDIPSHLRGIIAPEGGRGLGEYAPPRKGVNGMNGSAGKVVNGNGKQNGVEREGGKWTVVGGEGMPWQSQQSQAGSGGGTPWAAAEADGGRSPASGGTAEEVEPGEERELGGEEEGLISPAPSA